MLAGFKTLRTDCVERLLDPYKYKRGFFAEMLQNTLENLPEHLWQAPRRTRSYMNAVLARAENQSKYQPARRLWVRTQNGHYLPNPLLQLRTGTGSEGPGWRPVFEVLNLPWVDTGSTQIEHADRSLASMVEAAQWRAKADA